MGDGIPDSWRAQFFGGTGTTTNNQSCALCDPDGDGQNNLAEFLSGTVPTNSASAFRITAISFVVLAIPASAAPPQITRITTPGLQWIPSGPPS